ncbi:hypothetical protein AVEN_52031-1 [Araneus ventricosus]|uniref:Uncharacterized protein n=1 Tax=Araneus ventricosus TaxID=182803 RepID=A0A4Y2CES9_ARAVE|nr:hypothetical protein AVEN_52031-1 [Araneus ventricosus]
MKQVESRIQNFVFTNKKQVESRTSLQTRNKSNPEFRLTSTKQVELRICLYKHETSRIQNSVFTNTKQVESRNRLTSTKQVESRIPTNKKQVESRISSQP